MSKKIALPRCISTSARTNNREVRQLRQTIACDLHTCTVYRTTDTWKVRHTFEIWKKCRVRLFFFYHTCATTWVFLFSFSPIEIQTLCIPIYLSHSSTLKVGVVVVGVGGELCLLTRWFKDVSCTLSRLPRNALLWLANFSLFIGEPKITSHRHDAGPHINHNRILYNWIPSQRKWLSVVL